ncbi:hypothetical protein SADFL11_PLAS21 [Roseibium alexandrii DFL-11]|uniref:Uncharacterized protein n=1 Tax=Roseibium alexandrii (strain DSM 17067 / NCIMB 14079 / DFL-11) TaxID=244592 RepID=A0A5E8GV92_ROSAD|nr:hypothetical protein SADFL11_PLAS21 [Roseibium alexandrii DFL-11]
MAFFQDGVRLSNNSQRIVPVIIDMHPEVTQKQEHNQYNLDYNQHAKEAERIC